MKVPKLKLSDIKFKAVMVGVIVDNAGTLLLMTTLAALLVSTGLSEDEVMGRLKNTNGLLLGLIIGLSFTVLGGYFAGRMAKQAEVLHGALVAFIGMVIALIFHETADPVWFDIAGFASCFRPGLPEDIWLSGTGPVPRNKEVQIKRRNEVSIFNACLILIPPDSSFIPLGKKCPYGRGKFPQNLVHLL
jgi:hypothetical protein